MQANQVRNRVGKEIWDEYFTFCVERDPWSRSVSHYNMLQNIFPGKFIDFNDYLNRSNVPLNIEKTMRMTITEL